jgi:hypothetical protein
MVGRAAPRAPASTQKTSLLGCGPSRRARSDAPYHLLAHSSLAGFLNFELIVAIAILAVVMLPLGGAWYHEKKLLRVYYHDAIAMEILDGEMEVLAAGDWRSFPEGRHELKPTALAATNLPPGQFILTREAKNVRLEWLPARGRKMKREINLP